MKPAPLLLTALLSLALPLSPLAAADDSHDHDTHDHDADSHDAHAHDDHAHGAHDHAPFKLGDPYRHMHGTGFVTVALFGQFLSVETQMPGGMVFPADLPKAQRNAKSAAAQFDTNGFGVILPQAGGCALLSSSVDLTVIAEGDHKGHKDVAAKGTFLCDDPAPLHDITIDLFAAYPKLKRVMLSAETEGFKTLAEITPDTPRVSLTALPPK